MQAPVSASRRLTRPEGCTPPSVRAQADSAGGPAATPPSRPCRSSLARPIGSSAVAPFDRSPAASCREGRSSSRGGTRTAMRGCSSSVPSWATRRPRPSPASDVGGRPLVTSTWWGGGAPNLRSIARPALLRTMHIVEATDPEAPAASRFRGHSRPAPRHRNDVGGHERPRAGGHNRDYPRRARRGHRRRSLAGPRPAGQKHLTGRWRRQAGVHCASCTAPDHPPRRSDRPRNTRHYPVQRATTAGARHRNDVGGHERPHAGGHNRDQPPTRAARPPTSFHRCIKGARPNTPLIRAVKVGQGRSGDCSPVQDARRDVRPTGPATVPASGSTRACWNVRASRRRANIGPTAGPPCRLRRHPKSRGRVEAGALSASRATTCGSSSTWPGRHARRGF